MDRNLNRRFRVIHHPKSLSARRAWIEIVDYIIDYVNDAIVALRKESVDRNFYYADRNADWVVALRKESVDRNSTRSANFRACISRSPQGERG